MRSGPAYTLAFAAVVAGCGPVPVERAEQSCLRAAELAAHPRGELGLGTGSGGPGASINFEMSSDFIAGRDPSEVFATCVYQKSGLPPTQPLYSRTDWKG